MFFCHPKIATKQKNFNTNDNNKEIKSNLLLLHFHGNECNPIAKDKHQKLACYLCSAICNAPLFLSRVLFIVFSAFIFS